MILEMFSLRDVKAETFGKPIAVASAGVLIRDIQTVVNDPKGDQLLSKYPRDFHLYRLGTFDDAKGTFELLPLPDFFLDVGSLAEGQAVSEANGSAVKVGA